MSNEFATLSDAHSTAVQEAAVEAGVNAGLYVTVGFNGETRIHEDDQPGWSANFVHVYVRGKNLGMVFGAYLTSTPNPDAPKPGVYNL